MIHPNAAKNGTTGASGDLAMRTIGGWGATLRDEALQRLRQFEALHPHRFKIELREDFDPDSDSEGVDCWAAGYCTRRDVSNPDQLGQRAYQRHGLFDLGIIRTAEELCMEKRIKLIHLGFDTTTDAEGVVRYELSIRATEWLD